jgi:hypothetical protein
MAVTEEAYRSWRTLCAAALAAAWLGGCSGGGGGDGPPPAVTVLSASSCPSGPGGLPGATCQLLRVEVGSLPPIDLELRVFEADPAATYLGTVVACSGGNGTMFTEELGGGGQMIAELVAQGFRVVDRRWVSGWLQPGPVHEAAQRMAEVARWIHDHLHTGGTFAALGQSGGSSEIGYGLTTWQLADLLHVAVLTSGPGLTRIDYLCLPPTATWAAECAAVVPPGVLECGTALCTGDDETGFCSGAGSMTAAELHADSVLHPGAELDYPGTLVHVLIGAQDCSTSTPQAALFQASLLGPSTVEYVPGTPHGLYTTPEGRLAVAAALVGGPAPGLGRETVTGLRLSVIEGERQTTLSGTLRRR